MRDLVTLHRFLRCHIFRRLALLSLFKSLPGGGGGGRGGREKKTQPAFATM